MKARSSKRAICGTDATHNAGYGVIDGPSKAIADAAPSVKTLLSDVGFRRAIVASFCLSFSAMAWETVFVLFAYTPAALGGLERNVSACPIVLKSRSALKADLQDYNSLPRSPSFFLQSAYSAYSSHCSSSRTFSNALAHCRYTGHA